MGIFAQIVILILVLTAMVMVLLGIRQLTNFEGFENTNETNHLRDEVKDDGNILSQNNIFHNLVEIEAKKEDEPHNSNSKEPFSRNE